MKLPTRSPQTYATITRISLVCTMWWLVIIGSLAYVLNAAREFGVQLVVLTAALGIPVVVLGSACLLHAPTLRLGATHEQQRSFRRLWVWAAATSSAGLIAGLGAAVSPDGQWRWFGLLLALWSSTVVGYAVIPFSARPWSYASVVTVALIYPATWLGLYVLIFPSIGAFSTWFSRWTFDLFKDQRRIHDVESALQISQERLRIAQELHDSLGQQLAAMSVKTQLATAFAARGDARAVGELEQLHGLIRDSSEQMRQVVRGYRTVDPTAEIEGARSLLDAAGVNVTVHGDPCALVAQGPLREMVGWFVREAATNILRHSHASVVVFTVTPRAITIANDNSGSSLGPLSGLEAIRRRCEPLGATVVVDHEGAGGAFATTLRWGTVEVGA